MRHRSAEIAGVVSGVLRALSFCVPVALVDPPAARAQAGAPATLPVDILAQPLAQALGEFARHTGLQLVYVSSVVRNKKSHAVSAGMSANEALTRLLRGTELRFEYLTPDTIDILVAALPEKRTQNPPEGEPLQVIVTASRRHIGSMHNEPASFPDGLSPEQNPPTTTLLRYTIPGYTVYDAAMGVSKDNWAVQFTGSNLTDVYGPTNISSAQFIKSEIPLRPRVLVANFSYRL